MIKQTKIIKGTETVLLDFAGDAVVANCSESPLHVLTPEEETVMDELDIDTRNRVMSAMYSIAPGARRSLPKGTYRIIVGVNGLAFLSFTGKVQAPAKPKKPVTPAPAPQPETPAPAPQPETPAPAPQPEQPEETQPTA